MDFICDESVVINNNFHMYDAMNTFFLPYGADYEYEIDRAIDPIFSSTLPTHYFEPERIIEVEKTGLTVVR